MSDSSNRQISRRAAFVGGAMIVAAGAAWASRPERLESGVTRAKLAPLIPQTIGPWKFASRAGVIVATDAEGGPAEGYDQLITRVYDAPGLPSVMLLLAYGGTQGGGLQLHRPETCYPGQGFALSEHRDTFYEFEKGRPIHARRFTATRDDRTERLVYWTRVGHRFPLSTAEEYAAILASVVANEAPDGILVRLSILSSDIGASDRAIDSFAKALVSASPPAARKMLADIEST